jgi:predicted dehydrogenase
MPNQPLRVGLIGAGNIATCAHLPAWKKIPGAEFVGVADVEISRAQSVAQEHGIPFTSCDFHDVIALKPDVIDICTPNRFHTPIAVAALEAGIHVICEKPLAVTAEDVRKMGAAADRSGVLLMTAQHQRWTAEAIAIKRWVAQGNLGAPYHARVKALRRSRLPAAPGFTDDNLSGGGPCMDIGVHALDLAMWLLEFPQPTRISGTTKVNFAKGWDIPGEWGEWDRNRFTVEDFAAGFIHFSSGLTMTFESSWLGHHQEAEEIACELLGQRGSITWPSGAFSNVQAGSYASGRIENPWQVTSPYWDEIRAFCDAVANGQSSPVPWRETEKVISILEAIYVSQREQREIVIPAEQN